LTQIVPINDDDDNDDDETDNEANIRFTPAKGMRRSVAKSHASFVHNEFDLHEQGLKMRLKKRQEKARRSTQLRLIARRKLKDSKALHQFPAFSDLNDDEINTLIDRMEHITRFKNDPICHQHDISDSFYIVVKGSAVATVDDDTEIEIEQDITDNKETKVKCRTLSKTCPEQLEVGRIGVLECFGEGSLVKEEEGKVVVDGGMCSATVTVDSDRCELLRLKRKDFLTLNDNSTTFQAHHDDHKSVLEQLNEIKTERTTSNRMLLERRKSSKAGGGGGEVNGGKDEGSVKDAMKPKSLTEKGVPSLSVITSGSGSGGERSLFS
jgi:CRP-like cAMP-binding protein